MREGPRTSTSSQVIGIRSQCHAECWVGHVGEGCMGLSRGRGGRLGRLNDGASWTRPTSPQGCRGTDAGLGWGKSQSSGSPAKDGNRRGR